MPTPSRELRQPIFLPIKKLPIEPVPSPEMGLFDPQEHLLSRSGIVVNRRGRIVQLEVIGSNEAAVEEYTREVRIAVNVTLSRSNFSEVNHSKAQDIDTPPRPFIASADKSLVNQPKTRSIDTLLQQRQVVRDEIVTNPNHLVIFLNFAGFLTESTEKIYAIYEKTTVILIRSGNIRTYRKKVSG